MERSPAYLIETVGVALYGGYAWRVNLADDLEVDVRQLRKWTVGRDAVPDGVWRDLLRLLSKARAQVDQANRELIEALPTIAPAVSWQLDGEEQAS